MTRGPVPNFPSLTFSEGSKTTHVNVWSALKWLGKQNRYNETFVQGQMVSHTLHTHTNTHTHTHAHAHTILIHVYTHKRKHTHTHR
jgi:hypothetical protein